MRTETIQVIVSYHISYETPEAREDAIETVLRDGIGTSLCGAGPHGSYGWERVAAKLAEEPKSKKVGRWKENDDAK